MSIPKTELENAKKRGMSLDINDILDHLICEIEEFREAEIEGLKMLKDFPEDLSDSTFHNLYKATLRNSKVDELADLSIMPKTIAGILEIDLDKAERLKNRYNSLRDN